METTAPRAEDEFTVANDAPAAPRPRRSAIGDIVERMEMEEKENFPDVELTDEQRARAEAAASTLTDNTATELLVHELFSRLQGDEAIEAALAWLEELADTARELVIYPDEEEEGSTGRNVQSEYNRKSTAPRGENGELLPVATYKLAAARKLTWPQIIDVVQELKNLGITITFTGGLGIELNGLGDNLMRDGAVRKLFACLYIGEHEKKYKRSTVTSRLEHMDELTTEQMAGALLAFFTTRGWRAQGAIRALLIRAIRVLVSAIRIGGGSAGGSRPGMV